MAETDRSFRKFMTDPKTAVMHYIAENLPSASQTQGQAVGLSNGPTFDHVQFAPQQQPQTTAEISSVNQLGQPFVYTESSQPSNVYHQYTSTHLDPQQGNAPAPGWVSRPSSTPGVAFSQPPPQSQADSITYPQPWMSQHARTNMSSPPPAGTGIPMQPNQPASSNGYYASGLPDQAALQAPNPTQSSEIRETFGMAPPSTPIRQTNKPPAVSRAYHRMILEYEKTKGLFFAASAGKVEVLPFIDNRLRSTLQMIMSSSSRKVRISSSVSLFKSGHFVESTHLSSRGIRRPSMLLSSWNGAPNTLSGLTRFWTFRKESLSQTTCPFREMRKHKT